MSQPTKQPVLFLPHGGGPWPWMENMQSEYALMTRYMEGLSDLSTQAPRAILVISAHWERPHATLLSAERPPMLYDYYNFPPETYEVQWPAPGAPDVAMEIDSLLSRAGFQTWLDPTRGFDHGTFVPLSIAYPEAQIPTLQLSLLDSLDPAAHFRLGQALAPLREQGVLILGSGMSYHNLRKLFELIRGGRAAVDDAEAFDTWLAETAAAEPSERERRLIEWEKAPAARQAHPREEHLLPLHVCAGAGADDAATMPYRDALWGVKISAIQFG